ncbi:MAG: N-formylglutamate amidohydrolase [Rhodospirillaceae bacterium]
MAFAWPFAYTIRMKTNGDGATQQMMGSASNEHLGKKPYQLVEPDEQTLPVVLASPHSGIFYPKAFQQSSRLDAIALRRSEDTHVERLFADGPSLGAPILSATFPRAYLDLNREPYELDPEMFSDKLPDFVNTRSPRVAAGLGTIAKLVGNGAYIYRSKLRFADAQQRIDEIYRPYHRTLAELITATRDRFGYCILLDCHSMPSSTGHGSHQNRPHFVLGDCHGLSSRAVVMDCLEGALTQKGYRVARNTPYAGGFTTHHYGRPALGLHTVQVEIARNLYMNEISHEPLSRFDVLRADLNQAVQALGLIPRSCLLPRLSDETAHQEAAQ